MAGGICMRSVVNLFLAALLCLGLSVSGCFATAKDSSETISEQLGHVDFPNSCKAEAQPALLKGVALLHSFQYMASESAFKAATDLDGNCAIAHWGAAMALYHQLWDFQEGERLKKVWRTWKKHRNSALLLRENGAILPQRLRFIGTTPTFLMCSGLPLTHKP